MEGFWLFMITLNMLATFSLALGAIYFSGTCVRDKYRQRRMKTALIEN